MVDTVSTWRGSRDSNPVGRLRPAAV